MTKHTPRRRRTARRPASLRVRKRIDAKQQDLAIVSAEAWRALQDSNEPPYLFVFGGAPIRLVESGADDVALEVLTVDKFRYALARAADWYVKAFNFEIALLTDCPANTPTGQQWRKL